MRASAPACTDCPGRNRDLWWASRLAWGDGVRGATNPDNRPGSVRQGRLIEAIAQSPRVRGRAGGLPRPVAPVQRRIAKRGAPLGSALQPVQFNAESAELLTELATPIVRPGPEVEIQKAIVTELEAKFEGEEASNYAVSCLGAIELPENLNVEDDALIEACKLVDLPDNAVKQSIFELIDGPLAEKIVRNTIRTMLAARQVEYLRKSGLGGRRRSWWRSTITGTAASPRPSSTRTRGARPCS